MTKNAIIINIKRIRKVLGITQQQAAAALGISRVSYIQRESEKIEFKVGELNKLADFFCTDIEDILNIDLPQSRIVAIGEAFTATRKHDINTPRNPQPEPHFFEGAPIRSVWKEDEDKWYFSILDIVEVLTDSADPKQYIKKMLRRDPELNSVWGTICTPLPMTAKDGKKRKIQAAPIEHILRIIQSIPSKKAEPLKRWLAHVGAERIDEESDPELAMHRAVETYQRKGYDEEWIRQRLLSIKIRHELTDEWRERGIDGGVSFAILTDEISKAWSGMTTREYKKFKNLKKENLRDNMTDTELVLSMLAETSTRDISKAQKPETFTESQKIARAGGAVAGTARQTLEKQLGHPAITSQNAKQLQPPRNPIDKNPNL